MSALLQISDTHFGTERPDVVTALLDLVHAQQPDAVVLSGDITQRATAAQFAKARAFVDRLGPRPVLAIPGNHDLPLFNLLERLVWPYRRYRQAFGVELEPELSLPSWLVLGVNTTRVYRHVDGEVSLAQIERVERRLRQARAGQVRVVVVHQPAAVNRREETHNLLHGREAALQRWALAGADIVMGGHIHLPYALAWRGRDTGLWVVQAGTAVSSRTRHDAGNSVNLLRGEPGGVCVLERWDCRAGVFACVERRALPAQAASGASST
jgi:3',5'-cyclic AMP phosphodiesterase CpdA